MPLNIDLLTLLSAFGAGLGLGAFYFLGLWWTIKRLPRLRLPALWIFISFLLRAAIAVTGFYFVMQGRWQNLLICAAGFTLMRLWLVRRLKPPAGLAHPPINISTSQRP